jgi:hypothetical protein
MALGGKVWEKNMGRVASTLSPKIDEQLSDILSSVNIDITYFDAVVERESKHYYNIIILCNNLTRQSNVITCSMHNVCQVSIDNVTK